MTGVDGEQVPTKEQVTKELKDARQAIFDAVFDQAVLVRQHGFKPVQVLLGQRALGFLAASAEGIPRYISGLPVIYVAPETGASPDLIMVQGDAKDAFLYEKARRVACK